MDKFYEMLPVTLWEMFSFTAETDYSQEPRVAVKSVWESGVVSEMGISSGWMEKDMVGTMCGVKLVDRKTVNELMAMLSFN